jgi:broad specificity phosphatase PhoE
LKSQDDTTLLDFIRHGEPVGGSRYRGNGIDDPLSDRGWQQLRDTTSVFKGWQRIISSPMRRCKEFAQWLANQRGLPVEIHDDLREVGFGIWEGATRAEIQQEHPLEYDAFYQDPVNRRPPGAEPLGAFSARISAVFDDLLETHSGQHMLIVAHAGVIRAALGHVTRAPEIQWYRTAVDNAGLTRFTKDKHGLRLVAHNWRPSL